MVELDGFGKPCPMPLVMCKKEIDAGNTSIAIRVDNDTAVKNITRLAKKKGLGFTVADIEGGFLITREPPLLYSHTSSRWLLARRSQACRQTSVSPPSSVSL